MSPPSHPATAWIRQGEEGPYSSTRFDNLSLSAGATWSRSDKERREGDLASLPAIGSNAHYLHEDWGNLLTIISRVEWMHELARSDSLNEAAWMAFAGLDVEHFHVELRSAFDYLALIVIACSAQPGQTPKKSYNLLSKWAVKNKVRVARLLGERMSEAVAESREFFLARKSIREALVHRGARSVVFPPAEGVLFQVYQRGLQVSLLRGLGDCMYNANLVDFRRYASETLLEFWRLVEIVAVECFSRFGLVVCGKNALD